MKKMIHKNTNYLTAIMIALLLVTISCKDDFSGLRFDSEDKMQIYDYAASREDLSIYKDLLDYTNFSALFSTAGAYTIFMPTNDAFEVLFVELSAKLGKDIKDIRDETAEFWSNYISYHAVESEINTNTMENGILGKPTLFGEEYYIVSDIRASYKAIKLNSRATIKEYNIDVANGLVNVIDVVLLPPTTSIYDMLKEDGNFETMLGVFETTGLGHYLKDTVATILIETDAVLENDGFDATTMPTEELEAWAKYHIIENRRLFDGDLDGQSIYSLYSDQALTFNVDSLGAMWLNNDYAFSSTLINGINNVAANGVYHVLDTMAEIVEQIPGTILYNLYAKDVLDESQNMVSPQNVFTTPPAFMYEDTGSKSYHRKDKNGQPSAPICGFDAFMIGDYFWVTIPDVVQGKWEVNMLYLTGNRANFMMIYNDEIIREELIMDERDGTWPTWTTLSRKSMGEIEVKERGDIKLIFQVIGLKRSPSSCCDLLMDMIELSPVVGEEI